ncbi:MAG: hypothetical protein CMH63_02725 [Nanoarchaeota archaeon]|nr:hypothetical protein [Nanoarchaeota archaeon]|tara:strand:- start:4457 stop:4876 length:420 start_codon:yes stop_codon:yes gene_type:complete
MDPERLKIIKIKDYKYWEVNLHENQAYLGRCVIWCKREGDVDFLDMTDEEKEEFWEIAENLREALKKAFKQDRMNYAALANVTNHLHIHVIPRYKDKRIFENVEFKDERWGQNYVPYEDFKPEDELLIKIRDKIKSELK